jgi:hypothetical protein
MKVECDFHYVTGLLCFDDNGEEVYCDKWRVVF